MTIDLDALEKLADEATPGPWNSVGGYLTVRDPEGSFSTTIYHLDEMGQAGPSQPYQAVPFARSNDAAFIAAANPATIKALIAELKALQAFAADEISFAFCAGFKDAIDREKWDDCYDFAAAKAGDYRNDRIRAFLARNGEGEG